MARRSGLLKRRAFLHAAAVEAVTGAARRVTHRQDEIGKAWRGLGAETRTVEYAVMADAGLQPVGLAIRRNVGAQPMRRLSLADAGDIVVLAFDRKKCDPFDPGEIDRPAAMGHLAERQRVAHEHSIDGLQVELSGKIHYREILVVEFLVLAGGVAVALHQVEEQLLVRLDMLVEVHADKAVELQKTRIDVAHEAGIGKWHLGDDVAVKPFGAAML